LANRGFEKARGKLFRQRNNGHFLELPAGEGYICRKVSTVREMPPRFLRGELIENVAPIFNDPPPIDAKLLGVGAQGIRLYDKWG